MAALLRTMVVVIVLGGALLLGYWALLHDHQQKALRELQAMNDRLEHQLAARQEMIERLGRTRRIAHVQVVDQQRAPGASNPPGAPDAAGAVLRTTVRFIELDENGRELAQRTYTLPGDVLFIDAWTVKFDHERIAQGHPLLGRSLVLLRRMYSDQMKPADGFVIDTPGGIPPGYAASEHSRFEKRLWENFWTLATDAEAARSVGVRVAQGEAVYKPVRPGQTYELIVDAAGGMSLTPLPAVAPATAMGD